MNFAEWSIVISLIVLCLCYGFWARKRKKQTVGQQVRISLMAALSFLLMFLEFPLPFFPPFLKMDVSDLPALLGALTMGPMAGVFIEMVKNLLHFITKPETGGVGEAANFLVGIAYILPLAWVFRKWKNRKSFIAGAIGGSLCMVVLACFLNYYILVPLYAIIFGVPIDNFVQISGAVNGFIVDFRTMVLFGIAPFNVLKAIFLSITGYLLYNSGLQKIFLPTPKGNIQL